MLIMTTHRTFLAQQGAALLHVDDPRDPRTVDLKVFNPTQTTPFEEGPLRGFSIAKTATGYSLSKEGKFASAEPGNPSIAIDRTSASTWETFVIVPEDKLREITGGLLPEREMARFAARVSHLKSQKKPVKLYCGSGTVPRPGFLNLDIQVNSPAFYLAHPDEYFIFPFADRKWSIPDNSVDYIFHEDFIEHISQIMQWQFLAEALRVMKPGSWQRVNTPNLIASMKRHCNFSVGFDGVYTGELQWDHIAILTPFQLKEIAETIGYREVIFTTRNCGVSPFAEKDFRPAPDRDDIGGNIYADLLK